MPQKQCTIAYTYCTTRFFFLRNYPLFINLILETVFLCDELHMFSSLFMPNVGFLQYIFYKNRMFIVGDGPDSNSKPFWKLIQVQFTEKSYQP